MHRNFLHPGFLEWNEVLHQNAENALLLLHEETESDLQFPACYLQREECCHMWRVLFVPLQGLQKDR